MVGIGNVQMKAMIVFMAVLFIFLAVFMGYNIYKEIEASKPRQVMYIGIGDEGYRQSF